MLLWGREPPLSMRALWPSSSDHPQGSIARASNLFTRPPHIDIGDSYGDIAETHDFFGAPLAVGDFNGDDIFDLTVGIRYEGLPPANVIASGAVHIIYGSSSGLNPAAIQVLSQDTSGMQDTAERGDSFGQAVAAGDLNGDSFHDLAIGVPGGGSRKS